MNKEKFKHLIEEHADECRRLHARVHETVKHRNKSPVKKAEWEKACQEFHSRYNMLAFPGGYEGAIERIASGDQYTIEAALCFIEVRPYFFRSGYMYKTLIRKLKKAPLDVKQYERLKAVVHALDAWRAARHDGKMA